MKLYFGAIVKALKKAGVGQNQPDIIEKLYVVVGVDDVLIGNEYASKMCSGRKPVHEIVKEAAVDPDVISSAEKRVKELLTDGISNTKKLGLLEEVWRLTETAYESGEMQSFTYQEIKENAKMETIDAFLAKAILWVLRENFKSDLRKSVAARSDQHLPLRAEKGGGRIATYKELVEQLGYTSLSIAERLVENDINLYSHIPDEECDAEHWAAFLEAFPDSFRYLISTEKDDETGRHEIVGNWSLLFLRPEQRDLLIEGNLANKDLFVGNTAWQKKVGEYTMDLLNFSINPNYDTEENWSLLFDAFWEQMETYARKGIFFREILAKTYIDPTVSMLKSYGFEFCSDNGSSGAVYRLKMYPFPRDIHRHLLRELYRQHKWFYTQQLSRNLPIGQVEKRQIAKLLYQADPYIFPALFADCDQAERVLPKVLINGGEELLFRLENIFAAFLGDTLVGILLWHQGSMNWNGKALRTELIRTGEIVSPEYQGVIDRYFSLYQEGEEDRIYINFLQISEFCDIPDAEERVLSDFIKEHQGKSMEVRVFDKREEISLYTSKGFRINGSYRGFHKDLREEIDAVVLVREAE